MKTTTTIKFQWKTAITHPQNATNWNVEETTGDMDTFDSYDAAELIQQRHPALCGINDEDGELNEVTIGRVWAIDEDGEEVSL